MNYISLLLLFDKLKTLDEPWITFSFSSLLQYSIENIQEELMAEVLYHRRLHDELFECLDDEEYS